MRLSQLIFGFLLLYLSALGLYAGFTTQPKNWLVVGISLFFIYLAVIYLSLDTTDYSKYIKNGFLNIDLEAKNFFREIAAFIVVGLGIFILYKFFSVPILLGFVLLFFLTVIYVYRIPMPGIYKNGKYLGIVHKGFIKVEDNLTLGKKQNTETIGFLKILKDGKEIAKFDLTAEGFMELKPNKIGEIFPEIKGKIERFDEKNLFKVGDYTIEYSFFKDITKPSYEYEEENKNEVLDDCVLSPNYTFCAGNIHRHKN